MMGPAQRIEPKLFYTQFNLEQRVGPDNPLRAIHRLIDFDFVRAEVARRYGRVGRPSVDPVVLLKLMLLLFLENVSSERALASRLSERLDWMWFCGFDLDSSLPNHSVLSKARRRWGSEVFARFFQRVVQQCVEKGLVDGSRVYVDGSVQQGNASKESLQVQLILRGQEVYQTLENAEGMEAGQDADEPRTPPGDEAPAGTVLSTTDADARLTRKAGQTILGYKDHRVVDARSGIITATVTTDAAQAEADVLIDALEQHERNTGMEVASVTADKGYGTARVYRDLQEAGITPCIPHKQPTEAAANKFRRDQFVYDRRSDCYVCPAGQRMYRRGVASDDRWRYQAAAGVCASCPLRKLCSDNKRGRLLSRHVEQEVIDWADHCLPRWVRRQRMKGRKHRMEGSFADAGQHGHKRARWRRLWRMEIQNLLVATVQNLKKLMRWKPDPPADGLCSASLEIDRPIAAGLLGWVVHFAHKGFTRPPTIFSSPAR